MWPALESLKSDLLPVAAGARDAYQDPLDRVSNDAGDSKGDLCMN